MLWKCNLKQFVKETTALDTPTHAGRIEQRKTTQKKKERKCENEYNGKENENELWSMRQELRHCEVPPCSFLRSPFSICAYVRGKQMA